MRNLSRCLLAVLIFLISKPVFAQNAYDIDSLITDLKSAKEDTNKVKILIRLATQFTIDSQYDTALFYANQSMKLAEKLNYLKGIGDAYNRRGVIFKNTGKYQESLQNHQADLKIQQETGNKIGVATTCNNIGTVYYNLDNYPEALRFHLSALKISEELNDKKEMAFAYNNIGIIYQSQGKYSESLKNHLLSLKLKEELGDKKAISTSYTNIGIIYEKQGNIPEALNYYLKSLKISEENKNKKGIANSYFNIGNIYRIQGNDSAALNYYFESLKIKESIGDKKGIADLYNSLGNIYKKKADSFLGEQDNKITNEVYEKALSYYNASLKIREELGNKSGIAGCCINIGSILTVQQKFDESRSMLNKGLSLAIETGMKDYVKVAYVKLSNLDSAMGSSPLIPAVERITYWRNACYNYAMFERVKDSIMNMETSKQITEYKTLYETEKKDREIELLKNENDLKALLFGKQQALLTASRLETERNQKEMQLLNKTSELQQLKFNRVREDLRQQQLEGQSKTRELELSLKDKKLKEQELEKQKLIRNMVITGAVMLVLLGFLLFNRYQLNKRLEKQQAVEMERQRISGDMHDDLGSGLSKIALLSEILKQDPAIGKSKPVIEKISASAQEALAKMSEIVWSLNPRNDTLENLVAYIRQYAVEYMEIASIRCQVQLPEHIPDVVVTGEQRRNIFHAVKESLHNVVKHSGASRADLRFLSGGSHFEICIMDDGRGIDFEKVNRFGNGLRTMQERMKSIGGTCLIENNEGTEVKFSFTLV